MKLTKDQVKKVAKLANLPVTESEETEYSLQLSKILEYITQLRKVQTQKVEPTFNVTGLNNIFGKDEVGESLPQAAALQNGQVKDGYFVTRGIFEDE